MLLQVLDEGFLTDSLGKINFQNTIIIMTSNIKETNYILELVLFFNQFTKVKTAISKKVSSKNHQKTFSPEFLNRLMNMVFNQKKMISGKLLILKFLN